MENNEEVTIMNIKDAILHIITFHALRAEERHIICNLKPSVTVRQIFVTRSLLCSFQHSQGPGKSEYHNLVWCGYQTPVFIQYTVISESLLTGYYKRLNVIVSLYRVLCICTVYNSCMQYVNPPLVRSYIVGILYSPS